MPTLKQLETALVNADRAGDEEAARALAAEIRRVRAQGAKPAPQPAGKPSGRLGAFGAGIAEAVPRVIMSGIELFDKAGRAIGIIDENTPRAALTPAQKQAYDRQFAGARQVAPNFFTAGQITGEIAATAPVVSAGGAGLSRLGGGIARVAPRAGRAAPAVAKAGRVVGRVGKAVQTGGIGAGRTSAQSAAASRGARIGSLAERMAGGAISGGASAALAGQDVESGAMFGAGLPVVASVLKRVGGFAGDITKLPRQKAAEIIRKALGDKTDEARAAFAQLSPDDKRLAEQVLIESGVEPDAFFGIGKVVQEQTVSGATPMREALEAQAQTRTARLAQAAAGETATARRASAELGRQEVSAATTPAREAALGRANIAGEAVPSAEALATSARQRADEMTASGFVPRMRGLESRSREQLDTVFQNPAFFTESRPVVRTGEIAEGAGQRADDSIAAQLRLRQQARDMEDVVADLAAQGMQPLQANPIIQALRQRAAQPGTRADTLQRRTLLRLSNELEGLADVNGVIDARDLYQIRKTGVNDIVDRLLGSKAQPGSGTKERTASLLTDTRRLIDDAIEGAGGDGWKDYLTRTRQGFEAVNRQEVAAKGAQLAQESPNEFIALMRGERPKIVEDIMGPGTRQYDIAGMALADPQRYLALKQSADELSTLNRMAELRSSGTGPAGKIMVTAAPTRMSRGLSTLAGIPYAPLGFAARGGEQVERAFMAPRVERELAQAFLSGPAMGELVNTFPMKSRISEQVSTLSPMARNVLARYMQQILSRPSNAPAETNYPE